MTYQTEAVTGLDEIPALVSAFAAAQGWTVDNTDPNAPIFTLPTPAASIDWQLEYIPVDADDLRLRWTASGSAVPTTVAQFASPKLAPPSGSSALVPDPQTLHMFCSPADPGNNPYPYLAIVVEFGPNLFRHLYLGVVERLGNYTGGEVVSGCTGPIVSTPSDIEYRNYSIGPQYLFQARSSHWNSGFEGGMHIAHADNPVPWRTFQGATLDNAVLGGFGDGINDGYLARGESPFAGVNPLVPVNLYAVRDLSGTDHYVPVGRPPGVRHVHMKNFDPGAQAAIGGVNWRVFPALAKNASEDMPAGNGNWREYETSYYVGYAYPET